MGANKFMKMDDILDVIKMLSKSHGLYGRLYLEIMELQDNDPEGYELLVEDWEKRHFKDSIDFILYIEC